MGFIKKLRTAALELVEKPITPNFGILRKMHSFKSLFSPWANFLKAFTIFYIIMSNLKKNLESVNLKKFNYGIKNTHFLKQ